MIGGRGGGWPLICRGMAARKRSCRTPSAVWLPRWLPRCRRRTASSRSATRSAASWRSPSRADGSVCASPRCVGWASRSPGPRRSWPARGRCRRPNPKYATRREAAERHLKLAGLTGLVAPDAVADAAMVESEGGWTVAFDPAAFAVGAPDMTGLIAASRAPVVLAAGERDPMSTAPQLRAVVPDPVILPGLGHNAHVEDPAALWLLLQRLAS